MQKEITVEYDFNHTKLNLTKNGKLKQKYNCLFHMINLPLTQPLNPIPPPNQPDPLYRHTIVNATNTNNGWLKFVPIKNLQPNIVTIEDTILHFNKYNYHYEIIIDVIHKGVNDVDLRLMTQNPISLLASNMNDIYGNETVIRPSNGQQIKFIVTGKYQVFYVYYPTAGFNINITINVYTGKVPTLICHKKCGCDCYEVKGKGYLKINNCKDISVPVYVTKEIGNTLTKYLYPEFAYLKDLFYNITLANSLPPPIVITPSPGPDITIINVGMTSYRQSSQCFNLLWGNYQLISGNLVSLLNSISGCPANQISQEHNIRYRYSWDNTPQIASSRYNQSVYFAVYAWHSGAWYQQQTYLLNKTPNNNTSTQYYYTLNAGFYDNTSAYQWIAFALVAGSDTVSTDSTENRFNITITTL